MIIQIMFKRFSDGKDLQVYYTTLHYEGGGGGWKGL